MNPMDKLTGFKRIVAAFDNSIKGFSFLLKNEAAFRQEAGLAALLTPLAFLISRSLVELLFLLLSLVLVLGFTGGFLSFWFLRICAHRCCERDGLHGYMSLHRLPW